MVAQSRLTGTLIPTATGRPATVPTGTAFFGASNTTNLSFSAHTTLGGWTFNAGASAYTFTNNQALSFNGAGIVDNGGSATITNDPGGTLSFNGTSTAGNADHQQSNFFIAARRAATSPTGALTFSNTSRQRHHH